MGNKEKLLAGAKRCLYEKGYAGTTARDIVAASGTNLASIGYHFGSKEALLLAAMNEGFREWGEELERVLSPDTDGRPIEQLESIWTRVIESFTKHRALWLASFEIFARAGHSPQLREQLATGYEQVRPWMASLIQIDESKFDVQTVRAVGSFLMALQAGLAAQWLLDPERAPSGRELVDALRAIASGIES